MPDPDHAAVPRARATPYLRRIADSLGVPVEALHRDGAADERADARELLRLWDRIGSPQARGRVLALARREAERGGQDAARAP